MSFCKLQNCSGYRNFYERRPWVKGRFWGILVLIVNNWFRFVCFNRKITALQNHRFTRNWNWNAKISQQFNFFQLELSCPDTDDSKDSRGRKETIFISLYRFRLLMNTRHLQFWIWDDCLLFSFAVQITVWKVSKYGVFSGPYFPVFRQNTEIYSVNLHIQSEYRPEKTPYWTLSTQCVTTILLLDQIKGPELKDRCFGDVSSSLIRYFNHWKLEFDWIVISFYLLILC